MGVTHYTYWFFPLIGKSAEKQVAFVDIKDSVAAYEAFQKPENIELFKRNNIKTQREIKVRCLSYIKTYCEGIITEAKILNNILNKQVVPSFLKFLDNTLNTKSLCDKNNIECDYLNKIAVYIGKRLQKLDKNSKKLQTVLQYAAKAELIDKATTCRDKLLPVLDTIRKTYDEIEQKILSELKPFPTYDDILFD